METENMNDIPQEAMERLMGELENPSKPSESAINSLRWSMANDPVIEAGEYNISDTMEATLREVYKRSLKRGTNEQLRFVIDAKHDAENYADSLIAERYAENLLLTALKNAKATENYRFTDSIVYQGMDFKSFVERYAFEEIENDYDAELHKMSISEICKKLMEEK